MMKHLAWILLCTITALHSSAQSEKKSSSDTLITHKVMLIPYDPRYYLSDADRDLVEQSHMDALKIRSNFRYNIDRHVQRSIRSNYECISLLNDTADALQETMYQVLSRTGYKYEKAIPLVPKHIEGEPVLKIKGDNPKDHEDSKTATQYIPVNEDAMYMRAMVSKPEQLFAALYEQYHADLFVFLTQFEIKTNYKSCMDIANKIYRRELMVHFCVYDKNGRLLAGSYATSYFPSNSNLPNKIMGDCFPEIANYIAGSLP